MEQSTCHEMVIDLLKGFICMKCLFFAIYISLNMIFTLTLKESREMSRNSCVDFVSKLILWCERSSVGIFIDIPSNY